MLKIIPTAKNDCDRSCSGGCCRYMLSPLDNLDHAEWAYLHGLDVVKHDDSGRFFAYLPIQCSKLKDGKCSIYDDRPQMCRDYWCDLEGSYTQLTF